MTDTEYLKRVGQSVRAARITARMSQMKLGKLAGLNHASISLIECGHVSPNVLTLKRFADVLGKDVKDFL